MGAMWFLGLSIVVLHVCYVDGGFIIGCNNYPVNSDKVTQTETEVQARLEGIFSTANLLLRRVDSDEDMYTGVEVKAENSAGLVSYNYYTTERKSDEPFAYTYNANKPYSYSFTGLPKGLFGANNNEGKSQIVLTHLGDDYAIFQKCRDLPFFGKYEISYMFVSGSANYRDYDMDCLKTGAYYLTNQNKWVFSGLPSVEKK